VSTATTPVGRPPTSSARLILTLGVAGLLSGLVLVGVYEATLPTIRENDARALRMAVFEVVPGSQVLAPLAPDASGTLVPLPGDANEGEANVYAARDSSGTLRGYAIAAEGAGFQDNIRLIYGFDPSRNRVVGMRVLDSRETPGLGDKIFKDAAFVAEFRDLAVSPAVKVVPKGTDDSPNAVDGITGATISSKAVAKIVTAGAARWKDRLPATGFPAAAPGAPPVSAPDTAAPASTEAARPPSPGGN